MLNITLLNELKQYIAFYQSPEECQEAVLIDELYDIQIPHQAEKSEEVCEPQPILQDYKRQSLEKIAVHDIENFLDANKNPETFSTRILKLIDKSGKQDSEVYKTAGIDRRVFSKLRSNQNYKPSKQTAVSLCLALELNQSETDEVLELASHSLSSTETADLVIMFFINKTIYDFDEINEALHYFGCKTLGTE